MTQTEDRPPGGTGPLEAAQKIVSELAGMAKDDQSLALKFAMETLRLGSPTAGTIAIRQAADPKVSPAIAAAADPEQGTDIRSFTAAKDPKSDQQFAAVVAYFYQIVAPVAERKDVVDPEIMKEAARQAGRHQVKRWAMTLTNAKNAGYLDLAGQGKFKLNAVGENLVAMTLPGGATVNKPRASVTRRAGLKKKVKKSTKITTKKRASKHTTRKRPGKKASKKRP